MKCLISIFNLTLKITTKSLTIEFNESCHDLFILQVDVHLLCASFILIDK